MARMDQEQTSGNLIRALIYGPPKARKTWWAMRFAELGFNVTLMDLDDGGGIAKALKPEALPRIFRVDMRPNSESYSTGGAAALSYAMSGQVTFYDEETRVYTPIQKLDPERTYVRINLGAGTGKDVLIIDTWTEFVRQMTGNTVFIKSPLAVDKLEWDDYQKVRLLLDHFLGGLTKLNCHVIVVAHSETYAKKKPDADPKAAAREQLDSVRLQPTSVTRAHGETMAGKFNEVLFFENMGATLGVRISTKGTEDFDAGSRFMAPAVYKFDDFTADKLLSPGQVEAVANNMEYGSSMVTEVKGAEIIAQRETSKGSATITAPKAPIVAGIKR